MPLIEALSAGVPVVASDLAVFREIGQGIPEFVHPLDGPAWERAILSYSKKTSVARRTQLERLSKFKPPTWTDHFAKVESWLAGL